jgi:predicted nucleic acid-binding protein
MAAGARYLVDTNILLRIAKPDDANFFPIRAAFKALAERGSEPCFSIQNVAEFWNVCTRPLDRNGLGLTIEETNQRVGYIEHSMTLLPDTERVYSIWRKLIVECEVRGVQVHDARLAALLLAHGVPQILTLNDADFLRHPGVEPIHPSQVIGSGT